MPSLCRSTILVTENDNLQMAVHSKYTFPDFLGPQAINCLLWHADVDLCMKETEMGIALCRSIWMTSEVLTLGKPQKSKLQSRNGFFGLCILWRRQKDLLGFTMRLRMIWGVGEASMCKCPLCIERISSCSSHIIFMNSSMTMRGRCDFPYPFCSWCLTVNASLCHKKTIPP